VEKLVVVDGEIDPNEDCLKSSVDLFFCGVCNIDEILRVLLWLT
jgi:hypothetical protein